MLKSMESAVKFVSVLLGQIPSIASFFAWNPLYQPAIYRDKEVYLIVPLLVGVFAAWFVKSKNSMIWMFLLALASFAISIVIYDVAPVQSPLHVLNWLLFYCACALAVAVTTRAIAEWIGLVSADDSQVPRKSE